MTLNNRTVQYLVAMKFLDYTSTEFWVLQTVICYLQKILLFWLNYLHFISPEKLPTIWLKRLALRASLEKLELFSVKQQERALLYLIL